MVETTNLGPAVQALPLNAGVWSEGFAFAVTIDLRPMRLVAVDISDRRVAATVEIPTGVRSWGVAASGGDIYVGLWNRPAGRPNLYRYDPSGGSVTAVARIPSRSEFWALCGGRDGVVHAGTDKTGRLFTYDPAGDEVTTTRFPAPARSHTSALAATGGRVYAGIREAAGGGVYAVNRPSGSSRVVLSPEQSRIDGVYALGVGGGHLLVGASGPEATTVVMETAEAGATSPQPRVVARPTVTGDTTVEAVHVTPDGVGYVATKPSGRVHRVSPDGDLDTIAQPVPDAPTREVTVVGERLVGISAVGMVWTAGTDGTNVVVTNLLEAGADGAAMDPMSVAVTADRLIGGSNNRLQARRLDGRRGERDEVDRVIVQGEPKDLAVGPAPPAREANEPSRPAAEANEPTEPTPEATVYVALYPYGELWAYDPQARTTRQLADWPDDLNRPRSVAAGAATVWIGAHADRGGGGGLVAYDMNTGAVGVDRDILDHRGIATVVAADNVAYLGGEGADRSGRTGDAPLAALEPSAPGSGSIGRLRWQTVPIRGGGEIIGLTVSAGTVHGMTKTGGYFTVDAADGAVTHIEDLFHQQGGELAVVAGMVYAVSPARLVRIDPDDHTTETVLGNLDAHFYDRPRLRTDDAGRLYVLSGADVLRVTV